MSKAVHVPFSAAAKPKQAMIRVATGNNASPTSTSTRFPASVDSSDTPYRTVNGTGSLTGSTSSWTASKQTATHREDDHETSTAHHHVGRTSRCLRRPVRFDGPRRPLPCTSHRSGRCADGGHDRESPRSRGPSRRAACSPSTAYRNRSGRRRLYRGCRQTMERPPSWEPGVGCVGRPAGQGTHGGGGVRGSSSRLDC